MINATARQSTHVSTASPKRNIAAAANPIVTDPTGVDDEHRITMVNEAKTPMTDHARTPQSSSGITTTRIPLAAFGFRLQEATRLVPYLSSRAVSNLAIDQVFGRQNLNHDHTLRASSWSRTSAVEPLHHPPGNRGSCTVWKRPSWDLVQDLQIAA